VILRATVKNYVPAIACALTPLLCYIVARPFAEIGIVDDWSYAKTAQIVAQTGHIVYNGWANKMLGWQAYFGALLIRLLGFSFTAVRFATVIESTVMAFLLQRTFVRAGLNSRNATLATMTFILSPLCLPLDFTFMTDISGILCIVVCLYMCLRALQAESDHHAAAWIGLAALLNALGGAARQIAWLGVLVMVPSTLWLLRRNRWALVIGCFACITGAGIVVATIQWFALQKYSVPEPLIPSGLDLSSMRAAVALGLRSAGQIVLLTLPVLLMFAGTLRLRNRRVTAVLLTGLCCFVVPGIAWAFARTTHMRFALFVDDSLSIRTFYERITAPALGNRYAIAWDGIRMLLTGSVVLGLLSLVTCIFSSAFERVVPERKVDSVSWRNLAIMLGPFSIAYVVLLIPRAMQGPFDDRYVLPLFSICLLMLGRYYQERVRAKLPWACVLLIAIFGAFSVAATHDMFTLYRGYASAIGQLRTTGTPATAILGPWEFEGWTEVEKVGHVNEHLIRVPEGAYVSPPLRSFTSDCDPVAVDFLDWTPAINPIYAVLLDPTECGGQLALPAVTYTTWIVPHTNSIYTVRLPASSSN
jgi:hypothetical protein